MSPLFYGVSMIALSLLALFVWVWMLVSYQRETNRLRAALEAELLKREMR